MLDDTTVIYTSISWKCFAFENTYQEVDILGPKPTRIEESIDDHKSLYVSLASFVARWLVLPKYLSPRVI